MDEKYQILGKSKKALQQFIISAGLPKFTSTQLLDWVYKKNVRDFKNMTNISLKYREILEKKCDILNRDPVKRVVSKDATVKYLFETEKKGYIEAVYIPSKDRGTLCLSTQVGCQMNCAFCMTGKMGFHSDLTSADILNQIFSIKEFDKLTNIVFMGMGEPMNNLDNVLESLNIITSDYGMAWSPKRVTVSTVGIISGVKRFLEESKCHLAVSLHTSDMRQRSQWMPAQKANDARELIDLLKKYDFSGQRRVSFEYILFPGLNDSDDHVTKLVNLLDGLECRVNLIKFHKIPKTIFPSTTEQAALSFANKLIKAGLNTTIRKSRGEDIQAACGLLSFEQK